ncbi:alpha/beta hydrolase [Enterovirga sp.]|uniref:alpha/beta fold hydrolase n=1 Tax=Enterovirga sp. TaxID=2026350 RepID=UPI002602830F|nr:alpha/beta hydrolase [Enterovirga sp.]MDB5590173.1 Soluble epoxide hydrolase [Enterovirga sp.]
MLDLNGLRFHYQQKGSGPDIILVHAVTSNMSVWLFSNIMDVLAKDFHVTAYDMRGHGASDAPASGYTSADMAEDLRGLHLALNLGPAIIVGHSYGAVVATHAAVLYPAMVRGLILSDPYFPGLADLEPNLADMEGWRDVRAALVAGGAELGPDIDFTRLFQVVADLTPEQKQHFSQTMGESSLRWLLQLPRLAKTTCGRDVFAPAGLTADRLRGIQQPLVALYDEHTSFGATRAFLQDSVANITIETVPGARHLAPLQSTDAFSQLVQKHGRRISQMGAGPPAQPALEAMGAP